MRRSISFIILIILIGAISSLFVANRIVRPIESMTDNITGKSGNGAFEIKDLYRT